MKTKPHIFKTFPEFSKLTLADRERYEDLIADYPPISDISFSSLMTFWSSINSMAVSQIGECLVISYHLPGDVEASGLGVVGKRNVDEAICAVFDWQKSKGEQPRLVRVPEFTASACRYPELFQFEDERGFDECIIPMANLCSLGKVIEHKRWKIRRFLSEVEQNRVEVKNIDLEMDENRALFKEAADEWKVQGGFNDICTLEQESFITALDNAEALGYENLGLFIDGKLQAYLLYTQPHDAEYVIISFARFNYSTPHLFEFAAFKFAQTFNEMGVKYANIDSDWGLPDLRAAKLALGPSNFFRKYKITPR